MANNIQDLQILLTEGIAKKVAPSFQICAFGPKNSVEIATGNFTYEADSPKADKQTVYDIASVTKLFTASAILRLLQAKQLQLEDKLQKFLPRVKFVDITLRSLLSHTSGLALSLSQIASLDLEEQLFRLQNQGQVAKSGEQIYYSDQGFALLGLVVEKVAAMKLSKALEKLIFSPLDLKSISFHPITSNCAPSEIDPIEGQAIQGVVHNEFARSNSKEWGFAGLFATALDLAHFGSVWSDCLNGTNDFLDRKIALLAIEAVKATNNATNQSWEFGLGWRVNCAAKLGKMLSTHGVEITGFTGPQISLDIKNGYVIAICSNRIFPFRTEKTSWESFQASINDQVISSL